VTLATLRTTVNGSTVYAIFVDYFCTHRLAASRVLGWTGVPILLVSATAWEHPWVELATFFVGIMLVGVATIGRLWCSIYISGYKNSALVTIGPYSLTRNPLYFFSVLGFVGLALTTETVLFPVLVAGLLAVLTPPVIAQEERFLAEAFGTEYANYCARTPRFWPRLSGYREPETWVISPPITRRRMLDSLWFVWGVGLIGVIKGLHELGMLPTLLLLY